MIGENIRAARKKAGVSQKNLRNACKYIKRTLAAGRMGRTYQR